MSTPASHDQERLLARLTGPLGPEISCEECFEQLDRYVEAELAGADADATVPGMRAHLEGCSACAEDRESLHALLVSDDGRDVSGA
ncbi:MAG: zf-HC2 domain-containing protein [Actinobacteria bacterium]|nr:MAG: zf-HC2 domain-containing protein [Actinomycetota bacterium]